MRLLFYFHLLLFSTISFFSSLVLPFLPHLSVFSVNTKCSHFSAFIFSLSFPLFFFFCLLLFTPFIHRFSLYKNAPTFLLSSSAFLSFLFSFCLSILPLLANFGAHEIMLSLFYCNLQPPSPYFSFCLFL